MSFQICTSHDDHLCVDRSQAPSVVKTLASHNRPSHHGKDMGEAPTSLDGGKTSMAHRCSGIPLTSEKEGNSDKQLNPEDIILGDMKSGIKSKDL